MGGDLALRYPHPLAASLFRRFCILMGGLHSPPSLLLGIVGGRPPPPLSLGLWGPTGYSSWPPILGGSASLAIPPSVTREVQDVSSLMAPHLAIVRALPLTVNSHPTSLLGSSRVVSRVVRHPPPPAPAVSVSRD
jgi:hypothetical protein